MEEKKELYAKMAQVTGKVGYIKKRGRNQAQGYDYVMAADIAGEMGKLFAEHGLAFAPVEQSFEWETRRTSRDTPMYVCRLKVTYSISDVGTGQSILIPSFGEGMDTGDKSCYKAMTGALKYALIQTFLIAAGDDPEEAHEDEQEEAKAQPTKVSDIPKVTSVVEMKPKEKWCPECGQSTVIKGRPEFGGGYVCYKKLGGCGAKFSDNDNRVLSGVGSEILAERFDAAMASRAGKSQAAGGPEDTTRFQERERITPEQLHELKSWCVTFNVNEATVLKQYQTRDPSVKDLSDLTPEMYAHAAQVFATKKEKASKLN